MKSKREQTVRLRYSPHLCASIICLHATVTLCIAQPTSRDQVAVEVSSIGMTVSDLDRAVDFYTRVLTFEKTSETEAMGEEAEQLQGVFGLHTRTAQLQLGDESIELTEYLTPRGRPIPPDSKSNDRWFQHIAIITSDMDRAYQRLRAHKVRHASPAPQKLPEWNKNAAGIQAFYFHDPDGHVLEILQFPADKGAPKWHHTNDHLFLGIDHTAIVVADTDASLAFYRDALGLTVAGASENHGTEQERLNNVFGARLRITTLRASRGPAIEFLEYLTPRTGRPYPPDAAANDLFHWETTLLTNDLPNATRRLSPDHTHWVSSKVCDLHNEEKEKRGLSKAFILRDPDGHAIRIASP